MNSSCPVYNPRGSPPEHHVRHNDYVGYETFDHGYGSVVPVGAPNEEDTLPTSYPESIELQRVPVSKESPLPHRHWSVMNSLRSVVSRCGMAVRSVFVREKPIGGAEAQRPLIEHDIEKQSGSVQDCADGEHCGEENQVARTQSDRKSSSAWKSFCRIMLFGYPYAKKDTSSSRTSDGYVVADDVSVRPEGRSLAKRASDVACRIYRSPLVAILSLGASIYWLAQGVMDDEQYDWAAAVAGLLTQHLLTVALPEKAMRVAYRVEDVCVFPAVEAVNFLGYFVEDEWAQILNRIGNAFLLGNCYEVTLHLYGAEAREKALKSEENEVVSSYNRTRAIADARMAELVRDPDWAGLLSARQMESQHGLVDELLPQAEFARQAEIIDGNLKNDGSFKNVAGVALTTAFAASLVFAAGRAFRPECCDYMFTDWAVMLGGVSVGILKRFGVGRLDKWLKEHLPGSTVAKVVSVAKELMRYETWIIGYFAGIEAHWARAAVGVGTGNSYQDWKESNRVMNLRCNGMRSLRSKALVEMKSKLCERLDSVSDVAMAKNMQTELDRVWKSVGVESHKVRTVALSLIGAGLLALPWVLIRFSDASDREMDFRRTMALSTSLIGGYAAEVGLDAITDDASNPVTKEVWSIGQNPIVLSVGSIYLYVDDEHYYPDNMERVKREIVVYEIFKGLPIGATTAKTVHDINVLVNGPLRWIVLTFLSFFFKEEVTHTEK